MRQPRRSRRVIRKLDIWSVLKVSLFFYASLLVVFLVAGTVLFVVGSVTGLRHDVEKFIGDMIASDKFHLLGAQVLLGTLLGGIVLVITGTAANVVAALLYNLVSDVVGGIQVVVLEDEVARDVPVAQPAAYQPAAFEPAAFEPPAYEEPVRPEPAYQEPAYEQPAYEPSPALPPWDPAPAPAPASWEPSYAAWEGEPTQWSPNPLASEPEPADWEPAPAPEPAAWESPPAVAQPPPEPEREAPLLHPGSWSEPAPEAPDEDASPEGSGEDGSVRSAAGIPHGQPPAGL